MFVPLGAQLERDHPSRPWGHNSSPNANIDHEREHQSRTRPSITNATIDHDAFIDRERASSPGGTTRHRSRTRPGIEIDDDAPIDCERASRPWGHESRATTDFAPARTERRSVLRQRSREHSSSETCFSSIGALATA
jgi:hypothetical protein